MTARTLWGRSRGALAVVALAGLCSWFALDAITPRAGVGAARDAAPMRGRLPADARNVTYYVAPPASYYEFDTDEAGFEEFAANWRLPWSDRRDGGPTTAVVWDHAAGKVGLIEVADGVGYDWSKDDAGWSLTYDRRAGRAYCGGTYR